MEDRLVELIWERRSKGKFSAPTDSILFEAAGEVEKAEYYVTVLALDEQPEVAWALKVRQKGKAAWINVGERRIFVRLGIDGLCFDVRPSDPEYKFSEYTVLAHKIII